MVKRKRSRVTGALLHKHDLASGSRASTPPVIG
jgi:hypothetical protein